MSNTSPSLPPGFRFHPTDEELILHYLCKRAASTPCPVAIIADINIYKFNPWDLPSKAMFGEKEWYFFTPRDRKYPNGVRPNRAAGSGYWKATGTDKPIRSGRWNENIGVKKALVFYKGKPPRGDKTNWIMHEYRLVDTLHSTQRRQIKLREGSMRLDDWVLCRIYQKKRNHLGEQEKDEKQEEEKGFKNSANFSKIHKSFSVSEFLVEDADLSILSGFLETPLNVPLGFNDQIANSNFNNILVTNNSCYSAEQKDSVLETEQRNGENCNFDYCEGEMQYSKKFRNSSVFGQFYNQIENSQPFLNQQLQLSFQLGMQ